MKFCIIETMPKNEILHNQTIHWPESVVAKCRKQEHDHHGHNTHHQRKQRRRNINETIEKL